MDLDKFKGKTLDDETFADLKRDVDDLNGKLDAARAESISHRKGLKAENAQLKEREARYLDVLGIDSFDELEGLPAPKGQAEALKQFEGRLKKAERERDDAVKARDQALEQRATELRQSAIAKAAAKHNFIDLDDATALIGTRLQIDGDEILFKADGGKLVPLDEGAAWLAKTKPHLVKAASAAGSGFRDGGGSGSKQIKAADFDSLPPAERAKVMADGFTLVD